MFLVFMYVYICIHVRMPTGGLHGSTHLSASRFTSLCTKGSRIFVYMHINTYTYACTHTHINIYTYARTHTRTHTHTYTYVYIYICLPGVCMAPRLYTYKYVYIYTYTYVYIYSTPIHIYICVHIHMPTGGLHGSTPLSASRFTSLCTKGRHIKRELVKSTPRRDVRFRNRL